MRLEDGHRHLDNEPNRRKRYGPNRRKPKSCAICGALGRTQQTHKYGWTRLQHERMGKTPEMLKLELEQSEALDPLDAMDGAIKAGAAAEEAANDLLGPSEEESTHLRLMHIKLGEDTMTMVFSKNGELYHGTLKKFNERELLELEGDE